MKSQQLTLTVLALLLVFSGFLPKVGQAATTINATNKFAYGANIGWMDWRGDTNSGAVIGEYVCSGYIYSANVGWIHLGDGTPTNAIQYQNNSTTDYGVNHDGQGNLRGYAYGANIGWINFENLGAAKVDLATGRLTGSAYSANCGWISLSNLFAFVETDHMQPGADTDGDGIADAWERTYTNSLGSFTATSDTDHDGVSDKNEYFADTNPLDPNSVFLIRTNSVLLVAGTEFNTLTWNSRPTRQYRIQTSTSLNPANPFTNATGVLNPSSGVTTTNTVILPGQPSQRFFRVQAFLPLP